MSEIDIRCPLCRDLMEMRDGMYACITCYFIGFDSLETLTKYNENKNNNIWW